MVLVGLVRSLKSSHKEAVKMPLLCEDWSDITSPTSNHISDIDIAVPIAMALFKNSFSHMCVHITKGQVS